MVPMWTRAWRFANVYAYAAIDLLYALLWFAAFIAVAVWRNDGLSSPSKDGQQKDTKQTNKRDSKQDSKDNSGGCASFAYGSASKCEVAEASVGFGVIVFLLFALTSAISIHGVLKYRKTGVMPNGNSKAHGKAEHLEEDPNKDAWSANTDELDPNHPSNRPSTSPFDDDPRRAYGQLPDEDDQQNENLLRRSSVQNEDPFQDTQSMTEHGMHPGRPASFHSSNSATGLSIAPPSYHERPGEVESGLGASGYVVPSALSPSDYDQSASGNLRFPQGNYGADFR